MSQKSSTLFVLFLLIAAAVPASGQVRSRVDPSTEGVSSTKPLVTATVSEDHVRLTALALTQRIRLEVLSQTGEPLYDSDFRPGNRLEWQIRDQQGSGLRDGIYGCIVTVEDLNGQISHRRGILKVADGVVSSGTLKREAAASGDQESMTILGTAEPSPFTLVSHDGKEGWIESASGGLSFYAGGLSRSLDAVPQVRLAPEGNVGIGVAEPQAKLEVAGLIRASEGFQFSDGTVLKIEGGVPVLVTERSNGKDENSSGGTGNTTRMLSTGGSVGVLFAGGGTTGRVLYNETGTNTWMGQGVGTPITGSQNSFFGYYAGNADNLGSFNSFFGASAGQSTSTGEGNSFFGALNGVQNTTGSFNSFFGTGAGYGNTEGLNNSFFGRDAGSSNNTGNSNSFFGTQAGLFNTTASGNSFVGFQAGYFNTTGSFNSFFGQSAGYSNTADGNSFFGQSAGFSNSSGNDNSFFGIGAGYSNTTGIYNSFIGAYAGHDNIDGNWNSFVGRAAGRYNATGSYNTFLGFNAGYYSTSGNSNTFVGSTSGEFNTIGTGNSFFGEGAGTNNTAGSWNTFSGEGAGFSNTIEDDNSAFGNFADVAPGTTNATAIGNHAKVTQSNSLVLGSINGINSATADTNIGIGVTAPKHRLHVESSFPNPTAGGRATYSYTYFTPAANNSGYIFGLESAARYTGQYNLTANHLAPGYALAALSGYYGGTVATGSGGVGSVATVTGVTAQNIMRSSITVNHAIGLQVQPAIADVGAATVTNVYGVYVKNPFNVTPTNVYGLYTENLTAGGDNYAVYASGGAKSYFGGNVGIGTTSPTEKLHVIGNMRVSGNILYGSGEEPVPDYVFEPAYELMPIQELGSYLEKEKHLPNTPNAAEIKEKGLNLGEFQMKLLEKIEELTLYTVQQAKTIRENETAASRKEAEIAALKSQNATLDARLAALEHRVEQLSKGK